MRAERDPHPEQAPGADHPVAAAGAKQELRARVRARRRERSPEQRDAVAAALARAALGAGGPLAGALDAAGAPGRPVVALYSARRTEPGTAVLADALRERGARVLVPVVRPPRADGSPAPLAWVEDAGARGGDDPDDAPSPVVLAPEAVAGAVAVLLPALAVDRSGARLGQGGGHYDATLAALGWRGGGAVGATQGVRRPLLAAVVHDEEVLDAGALQLEDHDARVDAALTPSGWVVLRS